MKGKEWWEWLGQCIKESFDFAIWGALYVVCFIALLTVIVWLIKTLLKLLGIL